MVLREIPARPSDRSSITMQIELKEVVFHPYPANMENPSDRTMTLGSTQPLTEMNTRSISWG